MRLSEARDEFLRSRASQGYAAGTLRNNRKQLNKLVDITKDGDTRRIKAQTIDALFSHAARTNGPGALGNLHATLTLFFRWCRGRGYMKPDHDPMAGRRAPKHIRKKRTMVPITSFDLMLDAAEQRHPRDRAVIALGLYTMMRQSEIRSLKISDLDLTTGELTVWLHKIKKHDTLPVCAELDAEMRRWLTYYTEQQGGLDPDWFLVPARESHKWGEVRHRRLNPARPISNMHDIAKHALKGAGVPLRDDNGAGTREGMHTLRRSAARALFDELSGQGYDRAMREVQTFLNHSTLAQTEGYLQIDPDRKARNDRFTGKPMFVSVQDAGVIRLDERRNG